MTELLTLILGLLVGFYADTVLRYVKKTYSEMSWQMKANKAGVVRPEVTPVTRGRVINMKASKSGIIPRKSPDEILIERAKEREERLRRGQ